MGLDLRRRGGVGLPPPPTQSPVRWYASPARSHYTGRGLGKRAFPVDTPSKLAVCPCVTMAIQGQTGVSYRGVHGRRSG